MHEKNSVVVGFGKNPTASERKLVDKLTIYFQKQQVSGGCDVSKIQLDTSGSRPTALVIFEDDEAVRTVLQTKNHTLDIDGQNIPIHVEPFIAADEHTAMNMESDDYSLSLDSWVDLAEGAAHSNDDPDLYPEVHSDDDLYSSSMLSPNVSSSQEVPTFPETRSPPSGQSREAWPANLQTPSTSNASMYPAKGQRTYDQTKRSDEPRQRNKNVPPDSSQDLNTASMNWDGDKSPTFRTDSNSPLSSPKRPRTMNDNETERGGRNGQNSRNGRGERNKQLAKKKLALGEQSTEPPHGDGKSDQHGYRGGHQDSGRDLSRGHPGNEVSNANKHVFPDKGHDESGQGAAGVSFDRKYRDQGNPRKPPFHDTPSYQQSRPSKSGSSNAEIPTEDEEEDLPSTTVEVTNINPATSEDTLEMYFESRRRSGGGTIVSTTSHGNSATITFEDPAVAASVTNRAHRLEGADLTVILLKMKKPRPKRPTDRHRLLLTDIPEGTSEEKLLLFIEGRTKIEEDPEIMLGEIPGTAMLRYSVEIQDMEKVIDNFKKKPLQKQIVSAFFVDYPDCILVQNLTPSLTEDTVELYFECERKSGGGIVRELQMDEKNKRAIVFFEDWRVVDRVIRKKHTLSMPQLNVSAYFDNLGVIVASCGPTPHIPASVAHLAPRLEGADLNIKLVKKKKPRPKQPAEEKEEGDLPSATVEVTNIKPATSKDTLEMYFESRRSGGGPIVSTGADGNSATITFEDPAVAASVANRAHRLEGADLTVILVKMKKPRPKRPTDRRRLLLTEIPDGATEETLLLFIEGRTKIEEDPDIMYGEIPGTAMLRYSLEIQDMEKVFDKFKKKPLQKQIVSAFCVDYPDCILVQNLTPSITEDAVELYFESERKSGGGIVREIQMDEKKRRAIVFFEDWKVVDRVIRKKHTLSKTQLRVSAYFDNLGVIVASDGPTSHIPDAIVVQIDPTVAEFVLDAGSSHRARVDSVILDEKGRLIWPGKGQINLVEIIPVTSGSDTNCWVDWSSRVKSRLFDIMNEFKSDNIVVDEDIWNDVCNKLQELNLGNVRPLLKSDQATIILRGPCAEVENTMTRLACVVKDLEAEVERARQMVRKVVKLNEEKFKHLFLCNIKEELDKRWQVDVRIMQSENPREIIFEGMRSESAEAVLDMYTQLDNLVKHDFEFSPNKVRFVKHVQDKIHEILNSKNIHAATAIGIDSNKMTITGAADQDTRRAYHFITNDIVEASVAIQNQATVNVLQTQKGRTCLAEVNKSRMVLAAVNPDKHSIELTGFKADVQQASNIIQDFIEKNVILQEHIPLVRGKVKYLMEYANSELQSISEHNSQSTVDIRPVPGGTKCGITVSGTEQGLKLAVKSVKSLSEKIVERQYPVAKPGMPELLRGNKGKKLLNNVSKEFSCFIDSNSDSDVVEVSVSGPVIDVEELRRITANNGADLVVCKGDLTREKVDAIVNAANVDLKHIGGLAGDIVKKGGTSIQDESRDIIQKNGGPLRVAEAVFSRPGKLPCQHIIHVAGPKWERGPPIPGKDPTKEEDLLHDSVRNVLREASRKNLTSISIPAISSGVYGFPIDLCAKTVVDAAFDFCRRKTSLKEIRFTNIDKRACDAFLAVFQAQFGDEQGSDQLDFGSFSDRDDFGSFRGATSMDFSSPGPSFSMPQPATTSLVSSVSRDTISTKEKKTITLKRGDIAAENVNVIVNTTGSSMNLNSGGVSNAISAAGGPGLQQDCNQVMAQKGIKNVAPGDFIETGPGNINCQRIFHCVGSSYQGPSSEALLRTLIQKILQQANQSGCQSIAIPAIGTGTLAFPHDVVAQIMYDEVIKFSQQNAAGTLVDIRLVVYHRDQPTIKAFEDEMQNMLKGKTAGASVQQPTLPTAPARKLRSQKSTLKAKGPSGSGEAKTFSAIKSAADGSKSMQIGHITVLLQQGDLTKETTDAIINSVGHDLSLKGPMSKAIVKAGGKEISKECEKLVQTGHKAVNRGAVKTTAGRLPCKCIIHVATPHSGENLKNVVLKALQLAENDGLRSIAFPALGTGNVGGNASTAASVLLDAIGEFAVSTNRKSLLLIKLTIFQQTMMPDFVAALQAKESAAYRPQRGLWRKGMDLMKSALSSFSGPVEGEVMEAAARADDEQETLILHIYAGSTKNIDEVVERIDDFIEDEFMTVELPYDEDMWGDLDEAKLDNIFSIARNSHVKIDPLLGGRAKRIIIQGWAIDVQKAKADIHELFTKIQHEKKKEAEDQLINKEVQWRYKDNTGVFVDYGEEINPIIERAKRSNKLHVDLDLEDGTIRIEFFAMEERQSRGRGKTEVHRADLTKEQSNFNIPANWIPMNGQNCVTAPLTQGSPEFTQVQTTFQTSLGRVPNIHKIERIQVMDLYKSYMAKMERIKPGLPATLPADRTLFHGTSQDTCDKINRHGFNRSYSGKNGTAHGKGTYFAKDASYSDGYAQPSGPNNYKHMYMCKVLTGEYTQGSPNLVSPPAKPNKPTEMFDSVVNNIHNPGVFVVFHDVQAYPEYLIVYS